MVLTSFLRKFAVLLENKNDNDFKLPVFEQKLYLEHFSNPVNDIERSYFQYLCQMHFYNFFIRIIMNIFSIPLLLYYFIKKSSKMTNKETSNAIFFPDGKPDNIIPDELRNKVGNIRNIEVEKELLTVSDKKFLLKLFKIHPFSFHFLLKCLIKIRLYSYEIHKSVPKYIIVCNEYSFTSSVLTMYCNQQNIKHINVMHGEKYYYIRDSFFRFDQCYVWDEYYIDLFKRLRATENQFYIAVPPSLKISNTPKHRTVDYTYYLADESGSKLSFIISIMKKLSEKGKKVALRPHPRYSNLNEVNELSLGIEIEDCQKISIEESIRRTNYVISLFSTVLNQAYNSNVDIVIDDLTDTFRFSKLEELDYIMLKKKHLLLSEIVGGIS